MLKPLSQWICDVCSEVIEKPEDGYVIWRSEQSGEDFLNTDFKIIHRKKCDLKNHQASTALSDYLGSDGLTTLLAFIDLGIALDPEMKSTYPRESIKNLTEFLDFFRRLQTPYYEEARRYFKTARNDDFFAGCNELWPYLEDSLKSMNPRLRQD